jgi:hypothetical protein
VASNVASPPLGDAAAEFDGGAAAAGAVRTAVTAALLLLGGIALQQLPPQLRVVRIDAQSLPHGVRGPIAIVQLHSGDDRVADKGGSTKVGSDEHFEIEPTKTKINSDSLALPLSSSPDATDEHITDKQKANNNDQ